MYHSKPSVARQGSIVFNSHIYTYPLYVYVIVIRKSVKRHWMLNNWTFMCPSRKHHGATIMYLIILTTCIKPWRVIEHPVFNQHSLWIYWLKVNVGKRYCMADTFCNSSIRWMVKQLFLWDNELVPPIHNIIKHHTSVWHHTTVYPSLLRPTINNLKALSFISALYFGWWLTKEYGRVERNITY